MVNESIRDDILKLIRERETTRLSVETDSQARELVLAKPQVISQNPREVLKDKKIKIQNNISRSSEESGDIEVSKETCPLSPTSSNPVTGSFASFEDLTSSKERVALPDDKVVMLSQAATTSSRAYTGISAQHSRTTRGVKLMITLQTEKLAQTGEAIILTAELKRWDRLRELKPYEHDSTEFAQLYAETIQDLKDMTAQNRKNFCLGRVHDRGARAEWYPDVLVLGILDNERIETVLINIEGEEYEITMNQIMSQKQQQIYHSSGVYGILKNSRSIPRLSTAPKVQL